MKKNILAYIIMFFLIIFLSCNPPIIDPTTHYVHNPGDNKNVRIIIGIRPTDNQEGSLYEYQAYLRWSNDDSESYTGEFNDAAIWINNIQMKLVFDDFYRVNEGDGLFLQVGSEVKVIIDHELVGTIINQLVVPNNIESFTLNPPLSPGVVNTYDSYLMSWAAHDCTKYSIRLYPETYSGTLASYGGTYDSLAYTWSSYYFYNNEELIPYLKFCLWAADVVSIDSLRDSEIYVDSPIAASISNKP